MLCGIWRLTLRRTQCQRPARCRQSTSAPPPPSPAAAPRLPSICEYARHRIPASRSSGFGQAIPGQAAVALCEGVQVWRRLQPTGRMLILTVCALPNAADKHVACAREKLSLFVQAQRQLHVALHIRCVYVMVARRGAQIAGLQGKLN